MISNWTNVFFSELFSPMLNVCFLLCDKALIGCEELNKANIQYVVYLSSSIFDPIIVFPVWWLQA